MIEVLKFKNNFKVSFFYAGDYAGLLTLIDVQSAKVLLIERIGKWGIVVVFSASLLAHLTR